ncbi:MAG TPA: hypothetical protein VFN88_11950 [Caulobacteraceae bacterium]|nr:hypothetical protein [Caulobacteraceae bacterium]
MAELFESGEPEAEASAAVQTDGTAVAIALDRARRRKGRAAANDEVDRFLEKQEALIDDQRAHLHEQFRSIRLDRWSKRLRLALQALTILVGVLALGSLSAIAWQAASDDALVIDGFSVPPDLAQQGATGAAVATELHDKMLRLHQDTITGLATLTVREKGASEARVEIPETGVSLAEVNRFLRDWLGHERKVSGEIAHVVSGPDAGALVMNVRVGDEPGVRLVQADGDLEALITKAAEHVYGAVEPFNFVNWLDQHDRSPEALALAKTLSTTGDRVHRAMGFATQANLQRGKMPARQMRDLLAQSVALEPNFSMNNLAVVEASLGYSEEALKHYRAAKSLLDSRGFLKEAAGASAARAKPRIEANIARTIGDYGHGWQVNCIDFVIKPCALPAMVDAVAAGPINTHVDETFETRPFELANTLTGMHDTGDAARMLAAPDPDLSGRSDAYRIQVARARLNAWAFLLATRGDWRGALTYGREWIVAAQDSPSGIGVNGTRFIPLALAKLGDVAGARAEMARLPRDSYPSLVVLAQTAEALGDRSETDRWFAEALRQGPSLPQAQMEWARVKLARGDVAGALGLAEASHRKSPRYVDASQVWGEALLAQGDAKGAAAKFAQAAKLSPNWARVHLKWGQALARLGRSEEARAQAKAAAGLDLTADERAELAKVRL